jgi:hypothetical protein
MGDAEGTIHLRLHAPLAGADADGRPTIEKTARARVHAQRVSGRRLIAISWEPEGGGPFPSFDGTLSAEPVDDEHCRLRIVGRYAPPGGPAGALFDAALGSRIAVATVRDLLGQLRPYVEAERRARIRASLVTLFPSRALHEWSASAR